MNKERIEFLRQKIKDMKRSLNLMEERSKHRDLDDNEKDYIAIKQSNLSFFEEWLEYLKADEWVSVDERLPEDLNVVLIQKENQTIELAYYGCGDAFGGKYWFVDYEYCNEKVIAWKELPKPYVKGSDE